MTLRAIVIGAGWAGEGHAKALRLAGVDVAALCGRTPEPAAAMARKLGIEDVRLDWREAISALQPDIVSIATPASAHQEIALTAALHGCHIVCEKPLGLDAAQARAMLQAVERAGVKHGYVASSRYAPAAIFTQTLLASGLIGQVQEIEAIHHFNTSPLSPYSWFFQLSKGGGALYADFTHFLEQVRFMTAGKLQSVCGVAWRPIDRVPIGPAIHDMRLGFVPVDPDSAAAGEWKAIDADLGYTVLGRLQMLDGSVASVLWHGSELATGRQPNSLAFYGSQGSLLLEGYFHSETIAHCDRAQRCWQEVPIPDEVSSVMAWTEDLVQSAWHQFMRAFVADVRGEGYAAYPTFYDGWLANTVIDIVRRGQGWTTLPEWPGEPG